MTTERNIAKQMFRSLSGGLMSFILLKEKCDKLGTDERCPVRRFPDWALLWGGILSAAIHNVGLETV